MRINLSKLQGSRTGLVLLNRAPKVARVAKVKSALPALPARVSEPGRMRVILNVHGGQQGLADVMAGLVTRNERAIREGKAPPFNPSTAKADEKATAWKDAPMALKEGYVSNKTAAAWYAATLRARGQDARLGFRGGLPTVYDGSGQPLLSFRGPTVGYLGSTEGRSDERMILTIDDNEAKPVRELNQAIAVHNAKRMKLKNLPPLYRSGIKYQTEGSPELWWDAEEILAHGHDDCEGLAAYRAGELINRGYNAQVWTRLVKMPAPEMGGSGKGGRLFHAVTRVVSGPGGKPVRAVDGTIPYDDPSSRLGMPVPDWYKDFARKMRAERREL